MSERIHYTVTDEETNRLAVGLTLSVDYDAHAYGWVARGRDAEGRWEATGPTKQLARLALLATRLGQPLPSVAPDRGEA